ncbi:MAG: prepilin peptidase [Syntrophothermus sp.]
MLTTHYDLYDLGLKLVLGFALVFGVMWDLREHKVPNRIVLSATSFALAIHFARGGVNELMYSLGGLAVGVTLLIIPYSFRVLGAGDVKFLGTIGAIQGAHFVASTFLLSAVIGGAISVLLLIIHRQFLSTARKLAWNVVSFTTPYVQMVANERKAARAGGGELASTFPYGVAIGLGAIIALFVDLSPVIKI